MADKIPLVAVVGPTASGKTGLGIAIAKYYGGEVVSADSMQIYRTMDIATLMSRTNSSVSKRRFRLELKLNGKDSC